MTFWAVVAAVITGNVIGFAVVCVLATVTVAWRDRG